MKLQICCLCKHPILQANLSSLIKINCNHLVCSNECLCNYAISKNQDLSQYKDTKCPHENCNSYISSETIEDAFGGIEKLLKLIASQENLQALICPISKERHGVGCNITLDCSHIFCKSCIRTYLEECIGDCKISESDLSCQICSRPLSMHMLKDILKNNDYRKVQKFIIRNYMPDEIYVVYFKMSWPKLCVQ